MAEELRCPECHFELEEYIQTVKRIRSQLKHAPQRPMDYIRCPRCALDMRLLEDPEKGYRVHAPGMGRQRRGMGGMPGPYGPPFPDSPPEGGLTAIEEEEMMDEASPPEGEGSNREGEGPEEGPDRER
ncbi:MAG: hypothetical protein HYU29_00400 [Chloroflexi bacterium]|nr:hypothetical protein [Chloroflexota bacterium]